MSLNVGFQGMLAKELQNIEIYTSSVNGGLLVLRVYRCYYIKCLMFLDVPPQAKMAALYFPPGPNPSKDSPFKNAVDDIFCRIRIASTDQF